MGAFESPHRHLLGGWGLRQGLRRALDERRPAGARAHGPRANLSAAAGAGLCGAGHRSHLEQPAMIGAHILTALTVLPLIGAAIALFSGRHARGVSLITALMALAGALYVWTLLPADGSIGLVQRIAWAPSIGIEYHLGVDALGALMLVLSAIVTLMSIDAAHRVHHQPGLFYALILMLETGLFGTFTALNFYHWFIFWEASLIPAFFLIKLWGGPRRGPVTMWLAAGVLAGFAVKVPMFPFHTWLPAAYAEAPSPVTMLLTGAMSKMGVYGLLRIALPIFGPEIYAMRTPLLVLAVITVVMGAWAAAAQKDLKRIFAYSSVNHLGYCLLAIFALAIPAAGTIAQTNQAAALNGVILQMFNHGLTAAALFWFVAIIQLRTGGIRGLLDFGGLRKPAPVLAGLMGFALFSSLGLPGLNSFVSEFLIFRGVFPLNWVAASISVLGLLITAAVLLNVIQKVFNGPVPEHW